MVRASTMRPVSCRGRAAHFLPRRSWPTGWVSVGLGVGGLTARPLAPMLLMEMAHMVSRVAASVFFFFDHWADIDIGLHECQRLRPVTDFVKMSTNFATRLAASRFACCNLHGLLDFVFCVWQAACVMFP